MNTNLNTQEVVLFNPLTMRATHYSSITAAANAVDRDVSTVSRALSGDRGAHSVAGHLVVPVVQR